VSEYVIPLLTHARSLANSTLFLKATAACFREAWRIVDTVMELASQRHPRVAGEEVSKAQAEDVVCVFHIRLHSEHTPCILLLSSDP